MNDLSATIVTLAISCFIGLMLLGAGHLIAQCQEKPPGKITQLINRHTSVEFIEKVTEKLIWTVIIGFFLYATIVSLSN